MTPGTGPPDPDLPELEIQLSFRAGFIAFIARWWHIPEAFAKSEVQIALARKHLVSPGIHFTTGVRSKKESLSLSFPGEPQKKLFTNGRFGPLPQGVVSSKLGQKMNQKIKGIHRQDIKNKNHPPTGQSDQQRVPMAPHGHFPPPHAST